MSKLLEVFSDLSERLDYNFPDLSLYVRKGNLHQFNNYAAACHWHPDVEFILVLEGSMEYFVNGKTMHIDQGNGIFVNSNRLHYGYSQDMIDCTFIVVVIHPSLLGSSASRARSYGEQKFGANMDDFLLLSDQIPWQRETLVSLKEIYEEMHNCNIHNPLRLLSQALSLCASIGEHLQQKPGHPDDVQLWTNVWKMTGYIHQHYEHKITLDDIAAAGTVCRSRCCILFNTYVGQTPNAYLTRYRIQKSCEMLKETNRSICEIAMACGFQSASYFSSIFRKQIGLVPQDYRKETLQNSNN
ncbi:AraC family transcriptional regulator [Paenibacillus dokdonensis]|uniref:AraC family transcriptional regulator n=1 Tax=Paenibacillus dokdonensis TaxID=2567944 RepID=A0ABU6GKU8_9BACL|nr:AraC family transcriptional regulator [Paenibacillus dokdonensis]MEC0240073.1 AraC family transcriptional regulator [Paenibacillus dokdonensis]